MNRIFFAILVLGFFALTKARSDVRKQCINDYDSQLTQSRKVNDSRFVSKCRQGYKCVHGICKRRGEYKKNHLRLFRNCKSNLKKNSEAQNPNFYCLYTDLIRKQLKVNKNKWFYEDIVFPKEETD